MNSKQELPSSGEMKKAFFNRNAEYDGIFFTAVRSTGIFCRPSCPARKPSPDNVQYFATAREAMFAGYRACLRCRPMDAVGKAPDWAAPLLARLERDPQRRITDWQIRQSGVDPARVRRYFLREYGMTFQAYCRARRLGKALEKIRQGSDLLDVAMDHGYESYSAFHDAFREMVGRTPGRSRASDFISLTWVETPLGPLVAGSNSRGVCFLEFTDRRMLEKQLRTLNQRFHSPILPGTNDYLDTLKKELQQYFAGDLRKFSVPLIHPGSEFQQRVWYALQQIPYGQTCSYQELADRVGHPDAVRAVGTANGMNRICILIPCHRVINKSGKLGGYGGGLWRKKFLLDLEQNNLQLF
jgi:AraC family transcriptional regulator of adaptative response/methylated-DNA-[protein]-cysteine methyltransferase